MGKQTGGISTDDRTDSWQTCGRPGKRTDGPADVQAGGRADGQKDGLMGGQPDGQAGGKTDGQKDRGHESQRGSRTVPEKPRGDSVKQPQKDGSRTGRAGPPYPRTWLI